jgi:hypothetical protein
MRTGNVMIGAVKKKSKSLMDKSISFEKAQSISSNKLRKIERQAMQSGDPEIYEGEWINEVHKVMEKNGYKPNYRKWGYSFEEVF